MEFIIDTEIIMWIISGITGIVIAILGYLFKSSIDNFKENMMKVELQIKNVDDCIKSNEKDLANVYVRKDVYESDNKSIIQRFDNIDQNLNKISNKMEEFQITIINLLKK